MSQNIRPKLKVKDPAAILVYDMDWGTNWLAVGVTIATSTWTITGPDALLTKDQESIPSGGRSTRLRLTAGTNGGTYQVTNRIVTNETPAQTDERTVQVLVQDT